MSMMENMGYDGPSDQNHMQHQLHTDQGMYFLLYIFGQGYSFIFIVQITWDYLKLHGVDMKIMTFLLLLEL
jgi:hypothetical protein